MATATTTPNTSKPPYDPVKSAEGMFYGSVKRLAYALKDPANFGQETKLVLAETVKRFQDVLDDCEIQILDAKWYLEQQLSANKARREAKAKEETNNTKRKHGEIKDATEKEDIQQSEQPPKRLKMEESTTETSNADEASQQIDVSIANPVVTDFKAEDVQKPNEDSVGDMKIPDSQPTDQKPSKPPPQEGQLQESNPPEDFTKLSPQGSPSGGNEDFNFVSMFGEPTGDSLEDVGGGMTVGGGGGAGAGGNEDEMNFGLNLGDLDDPSNLDSFLQADNNNNDENNLNVQQDPTSFDGLNNNNTTNNNNNNNNNTLDLPDLPNEFDDFLNSTDFGNVDGTGLGDGNFDDNNLNLSDEAMLNLDDFDTLF